MESPVTATPTPPQRAPWPVITVKDVTWPGGHGEEGEEALGVGRRSVVRRGQWCGVDVAVKQLKQDQAHRADQCVGRFRHEADILWQCKGHAHICQLVGACVDPTSGLQLVLEMLPSSLQHRLDTNHDSMSMHERLSWCFQLADALKFLHEQSPAIIHRDVKPDNCLIDVTNRLKLTDFGLAAPVGSDRLVASVVVGTHPYFAPEVLEGNGYAPCVDTYAWALSSWYIVSGSPPFDNVSGRFQLKVCVCSHRNRPLIPDDWPTELTSLLQRSWDHYPRERPTMCSLVDALEPCVRPTSDPE